MRTQVFTPAVLFCAALAATMASDQVAEAGQADGGGQTVRPVPVIEGTVEVERIGFNAKETGDGMAKGQIQFSLKRDGEIVFISHLEIDCMLFLGEHTALVGGVVTNDTDPDFIGTTAVFAVRDNGEGHNAPADERSTVFYSLDLGFEVDCETAAFLIAIGEVDLEEILSPIDTGNIQVNP